MQIKYVLLADLEDMRNKVEETLYRMSGKYADSCAYTDSIYVYGLGEDTPDIREVTLQVRMAGTTSASLADSGFGDEAIKFDFRTNTLKLVSDTLLIFPAQEEPHDLLKTAIKRSPYKGSIELAETMCRYLDDCEHDLEGYLFYEDVIEIPFVHDDSHELDLTKMLEQAVEEVHKSAQDIYTWTKERVKDAQNLKPNKE